MGQNQNPKEFKEKIEREVLKVIHNLAKQKKVSADYLSSMARYTLTLFSKTKTIEEIYKAAVKLDDKYPELAEVVFKIMKEYEEKYEKKAVNLVSSLIKQGKYKEAEDTVKKVLEFKAEYGSI